MPVIAADVIRSLAGFKPEGVPVTSCYLDVDGRRLVRQRDVEHELDQLLRKARQKANGHRSVHDDLHRIEEYVRGGFDRSRTRGLAIFSCAEQDLWEVIPLPLNVHNRVVINAAPAVSQLEAVLEAAAAMGVLLVDRQRVRTFVFELDELTERTERTEAVPRDIDGRGEKDQGDHARGLQEHVQQHLRQAADAAWQMYSDHPFDHLAVAVPDDMANELTNLLHPYLRQRLCGRLPLTAGASLDEIRAAVLDMEVQVEREREAALVAQLREAVGAGRRGVAGLQGVLEALSEHRVEHLLVSEGYSEDGWRCPSTGVLASVGPKSPTTGEPMERVDDVVEEAIELALAQGCRVEICVGSADLDVLGRIGALLRY